MTEQRLLADLQRLGVRPGDLLMVHASLRKTGLASTLHGGGGADLLLDALDAAVGPEGSLLMLIGTHYPMDEANKRPIAERAALLEGTAPFDYHRARAMPEAGGLAEAFRLRPGTLLSDNPSGRFAARGRLARALTDDVPWNDYYGPGSPLDRLCAFGGRIARIGADEDTVTALHLAEYRADIEGKRRTRWDYVLEGEGGPRHAWVECLDDSEGIARWDGEDYFAAILKAYRALGRHREGRVGDADAELIAAADIVAFAARWMERNLRPD
jgi:aminoglycoside N3'-acetyltransferase